MAQVTLGDFAPVNKSIWAVNNSTEADVIEKEKVEGVVELQDDVTDIKTADYGAGVNLLDFDKMLDSIGYSYSKTSENVYTIDNVNITGWEVGFQFSDKDIPITYSYTVSDTGTNARLEIGDSSGNWVTNSNAQGSYELKTNGCKVRIGYSTGGSTTFTKPMIRPAEITDSTYHPYIKTNHQLQEDVAVLPENAKKNLFDGLFSDTLPVIGTNYTDKVIDRTQNTLSGNKFGTIGAWLKAGAYILSEHSNIYISLNRIGIAGTDTLPLGYPLRGEYEFTTSVDGWTYFGIERDAGETDYTDINFDGTDLKIMLRPAGTSPDYVPYMRSNLELTHDTDGIRGVGRNLLEITEDSQTVNGITFTVDKTAGTVTLNGTTTSRTTLGACFGTYDAKEVDGYIASGFGALNGSTSYGYFSWRDSAGNYVSEQSVAGEDVVLKSNGNPTLFAGVTIATGESFSNAVLKPMIRSAKYADDPTFYPYSENEIEFQSKLRPITVGTMYDADNVAAVHNAHPRGKNITDIFNAGELSEMIGSGLFDEIYPGDYFSLPMEAVTDRWSARTFTCRVMHLNPMKYVGDGTLNITDNHIGFATDESWFNCAWNESGTTAGGYAGSTIHGRINEEAIITAWQNALSSKLTLMQARMLLSSAVNTEVDSAEYPGQKGMANNWGWYTNYFKLMSEMERYGAPVWSSGKGLNTGSSHFQLAYYANNAALRGNKRRTWDWLSDIVSVSHAAYGGDTGYAGCSTVTNAGDVRPLGFLKS